jgi:hypothetical protein
MSLQIKDTSVIRTAIDEPKWSGIEMCSYLTSELILYYECMVLLQTITLHTVNGLDIMVKTTPPLRSQVLALQFLVDYLKDG